MISYYSVQSCWIYGRIPNECETLEITVKSSNLKIRSILSNQYNLNFAKYSKEPQRIQNILKLYGIIESVLDSWIQFLESIYLQKSFKIDCQNQ